MDAPWTGCDGTWPSALPAVGFDRVETLALDGSPRPVMFARHVSWADTSKWRAA